MAKTKESGKDIGLFANAATQVFSKWIEERKYRLIEINPHPDHQAVVKHLLAPINLRHVTIFNNGVVLYVGYDDQIRITQEEWNRIKIHFGAGQNCTDFTEVNPQTKSEVEEE